VPNETQALTRNHRRAASGLYDSPQRRERVTRAVIRFVWYARLKNRSS